MGRSEGPSQTAAVFELKSASHAAASTLPAGSTTHHEDTTARLKQLNSLLDNVRKDSESTGKAEKPL
jgi:hypothetical protein